MTIILRRDITYERRRDFIIYLELDTVNSKICLFWWVNNNWDYNQYSIIYFMSSMTVYINTTVFFSNSYQSAVKNSSLNYKFKAIILAQNMINLNSNFILYHSPTWLSIGMIVATLETTVLSWSGEIIHKYMLEITV